jgi:hypothetical protein
MSGMVEQVMEGLRPLMFEADDELIRKLARAAVEAMREPTDAMITAVPFGEDTMREHWPLMIDAALAE